MQPLHGVQPPAYKPVAATLAYKPRRVAATGLYANLAAPLAQLRCAYKTVGFVRGLQAKLCRWFVRKSSICVRTLAKLLLQIYDLQAKLCVQNRRFCKGFVRACKPKVCKHREAVHTKA